MSIIDTGVDKAKEWLLSVALKKAVVSAVKVLVSWCVAHGVTIVANVGGMSIDTTSEAAMIVVINSLLTMLRNWAKVKFPKACGWM